MTQRAPNDVNEEFFLPLQDLSHLDQQNNSKSDGAVVSFASWFATSAIHRARYKDFSSMDWIFDNYKARERIQNLEGGSKTLLGKLKLSYELSQPWIVLLLVGVSVGILSTIISITTQWMIDLRDGYCKTGFYLNQKFCCWKADGVKWSIGENTVQFSSYLLDSVVFSGIATFLVISYAPFAAGQGIAELKTIMSGFIMKEFLSAKTLLIKSVSIVFAVASGLSVGKEVALVHISACCANFFSGIFPSIKQNEAQKRQLLSAASAAGISVAFGAPIAGVLFSLEGIVGSLVVKLDSMFSNYRQKSFLNKFARGEVVVVAALTSIICYGNIFARSDAVTLVSNLFTECRAIDNSGICE
ncbi:H(+)/Cl(-) exchange transporter 3 [Smittium mucronatum]|uniref:H(+)/Cl(-) exchange transporter 3 n=1 Tax=Smittium mucronatum TaxID=133383 RepID=A0A1R0H710_9FUNG|nr:H(+)/Cl(-) exchange transporter 3 [Smittium mucronatum]